VNNQFNQVSELKKPEQKPKREKSAARVAMDELDKAMVSQVTINLKIEKLQKSLIIANERVKEGSSKLAKILG
jgi:hypothetical protein